jgi:hypothetical protein
MKQRKHSVGSATERIRRSLFKGREIESYGELTWVMDPDAVESQPRRPWRQELDRMSVTKIATPARHTF